MSFKIHLFVLFALALLFAGCSNHPPSAAQFMNVKKNGMDFVVGGAGLVPGSGGNHGAAVPLSHSSRLQLWRLDRLCLDGRDIHDRIFYAVRICAVSHLSRAIACAKGFA